MNLPLQFRPGHRVELGSYRFEADDIIRFARKYDPQRFHIDPEAARNSVLGGLCASGWHTAAVWMRCQREYARRPLRATEETGRGTLIYGPSPGVENLKWLRPVYAGDRITYYNETISCRPSKSKPGWHILTGRMEGVNQDGKPVIQFDSIVFAQWMPE